MSNYPDDFRGTNMDASHCAVCGHQDYTDEHGVCGECQWKQKERERIASRIHAKNKGNNRFSAFNAAQQIMEAL